VAKPIVDGLEADLAGQADVIRLDLLSAVGRQAASDFGVRGLPTLVLVDGQGEVVGMQVGLIRAGAVREAVDKLVSN
jgi:thioredoxin-like negative regulator of GroEL